MYITFMEEILNKPLWATKAQKKMKALNVTQADIRDHIGLETTGAIGHWFNGRRSPSLKNLEMLAEFLETSIPELFETENSEKELKGDGKHLKDALMLLCRAVSIPEEQRVNFISVFDQLGADNIIKATSALSEAENTNKNYTDVVINILDYANNKTG